MDPGLRSLAMRAALLAANDRAADAAYAATLAALRDLDWRRLSREERARVRELSGRCGRLGDGGWDFSRLRRAEVDELAGLVGRAIAGH